ncbi:TRM11 family SAM-dependent methyltransferase [Amycolatopsis aidingensis]|uniref:TRM11 family SAM-dependent methyltransferase n=1 Tax=Amycolatopsis aidingensis TaxID=2842453 RepID=UPI0038CC1230
MPHTQASPTITAAADPVAACGGIDELTMPIPRSVIIALDSDHPGREPAPHQAEANPTDPDTPDATRTGRAEDLPTSVWVTAQTSPAAQRKGRFVPESTAHPAKMLPAVAAHAVRHYTRPGELVLDPMCGIGTTLVEAIDAGRHAIGVEYEPHWVQVTRANLELARERGHQHDGEVITGDARQLDRLLPPKYLGQVALVVTSPPYGPSLHGQVSTAGDPAGDGKVHKFHHRYGNHLDRGNLANIGHHRLLAGFARILAACVRVLRPGGHVAITVRPWREHSELINLPSQILACGVAAGLVPVERSVALLARVADTELVARGSFFQRDFIRKQREAGLPLHLIAHEDVIVLRRSFEPAGHRLASPSDRTRMPSGSRDNGAGKPTARGRAA